MGENEIMIKIAVCEDDKYYCELLGKNIIKCVEEDLSVKVEIDFYHDGETLVDSLKDKKYHLVFMDIDLPKMTGIDVTRKIREKDKDCLIIFVTGYSSYVMDSFRSKAFQYIEKPFDVEVFNNELKRAVQSVLLGHSTAAFTLHSTNIVFSLSEIYYIETSYRDFILHTVKGSFVGPVKSIKETKKRLEEYNFFKIHRSYLINTKEVRAYDSCSVTMRNGDVLPISKKRVSQFKKALLKISII